MHLQVTVGDTLSDRARYFEWSALLSGSPSAPWSSPHTGLSLPVSPQAPTASPELECYHRHQEVTSSCTGHFPRGLDATPMPPTGSFSRASSSCPGEVPLSSPPCKSLTSLSPHPHPSSLLCAKPNCLLHTRSPAGRCGFRKTWSPCGRHVTSIARISVSWLCLLCWFILLLIQVTLMLIKLSRSPISRWENPLNIRCCVCSRRPPLGPSWASAATPVLRPFSSPHAALHRPASPTLHGSSLPPSPLLGKPS